MAKKHIIAMSANNKEIYVYLIQTVAAAQISRQPHLASLVKEIADSLILAEPTVSIEYDMGRTIGYGEILETKENDTIFYAKQAKSDAYTRFVKNRKTQPTSSLCMTLSRDKEGDYELTGVYIGEQSPAIPGTEDATGESKNFWETHAVVYNGQPILASTQTKDCPY